MEDQYMDIYTPRRSRIRFTHPSADWSGNIRIAKRILVLGREYTIKNIEVDCSYTSVELEEHSGYIFSSCMFSNVEE